MGLRLTVGSFWKRYNKQINERAMRQAQPFWFARHGRALTGESPEHA